MPAHGDLVSAVDFSSAHLVTGFEDAMLGVWELPSGAKVITILRWVVHKT